MDERWKMLKIGMNYAVVVDNTAAMPQDLTKEED